MLQDLLRHRHQLLQGTRRKQQMTNWIKHWLNYLYSMSAKLKDWKYLTWSRYPSSQKISNSVEGRPSLTELLSVSLQFLDADAEMRRFFGSKVVLASKS